VCVIDCNAQINRRNSTKIQRQSVQRRELAVINLATSRGASRGGWFFGEKYVYDKLYNKIIQVILRFTFVFCGVFYWLQVGYQICKSTDYQYKYCTIVLHTFDPFHICTMWKSATYAHRSRHRFLAAWRSGHCIRLRNRRRGLESRQGIRFLRENKAMLLCIIALTCIFCVEKGAEGIRPFKF
jgi:hypothetical protein